MAEPKVTLKKPSEQVVAQALQEIKITDSTGRNYVLRKPGVLAQFRLVEALGDTAANQTYMRMVLPLLFVASIDDEQLLPPIKKPQVEALIQRLGDEGIEAVLKGVADNFGAPDPEADKAAIKN